MSAVLSRWPGCVIQFEDFETKKAEPLLKKYRELRVFNDDIQVPALYRDINIISKVSFIC